MLTYADVCGQACQRFVATSARKEALVGSEAASLEVENGRYAGGYVHISIYPYTPHTV
jgi:hypothetical protein